MRGAALRWVVDAGCSTVGEVLRAMGAVEALGDGRAFANGTRASDEDEAVAPGDVVEVFEARPASEATITLLDERDGVFAVLKPAPLAMVPDHRGTECLVTQLARSLGVPADDVHAASRLDVGVSGVVLVAVGAHGRKRLVGAQRMGTHRRGYVGIARAVPEPPAGVWRAPVRRGAGPPKPAETRYRTVGSVGDRIDALGRLRERIAPGLLAFEPVTGRTHQIREHAAAAGCPLLGDRARGGPSRLVDASGAVRSVDRVALHADRAELEGWRVDAPIPSELRSLWRWLGGREDDWSLDRHAEEAS